MALINLGEGYFSLYQALNSAARMRLAEAIGLHQDDFMLSCGVPYVQTREHV